MKAVLISPETSYYNVWMYALFLFLSYVSIAFCVCVMHGVWLDLFLIFICFLLTVFPFNIYLSLYKFLCSLWIFFSFFYFLFLRSVQTLWCFCSSSSLDTIYTCFLLLPLQIFQRNFVFVFSCFFFFFWCGMNKMAQSKIMNRSSFIRFTFYI